ncbi:MAG: MarR family transcriptional regulator [Cyclobacteriaceae bacterium]|nr:MarR family transcriptional regulator [Cyclobacteriaceae bacterium]
MPIDEKLEDVLYYLIDKTNKVARRYSQEAFVKAGYDITVDQWLVLKKIWDNKEINQVALATALFKDTASITRILQILVRKKLVKKESKEGDRRHYLLSLTTKGEQFFKKVLEMVKSMRTQGVIDFSDAEKEQIKKLLSRMIKNLAG